jgi:GNAT superfamily N-acetyltransferase
MSRPSRATADRIVASEDRLAEAGAEVFILDVGRVVRQPRYPHVFDANLIRHPRLSRHNLDEALERLEAPLRAVGAGHLQISVDDGTLPDVVAADLRRRGFFRDRLLVMVLRGRPARRRIDAVAIHAVPTDAPFEWYADVMDTMSREEVWYTPLLSREIIGSLSTKADAGVMVLHVATLHGRPAGAAGLAVCDRGAACGVGAIATVGTVPDARHRGVAQSMVVTLADKALRAGCDLVYLVARADDTPKDMYRKLGFDVLYGFDVWLRPPAD